jgi:hypothetical protein
MATECAMSRVHKPEESIVRFHNRHGLSWRAKRPLDSQKGLLHRFSTSCSVRFGWGCLLCAHVGLSERPTDLAGRCVKTINWCCLGRSQGSDAAWGHQHGAVAQRSMCTPPPDCHTRERGLCTVSAWSSTVLLARSGHLSHVCPSVRT